MRFMLASVYVLILYFPFNAQSQYWWQTTYLLKEGGINVCKDSCYYIQNGYCKYNYNKCGSRPLSQWWRGCWNNNYRWKYRLKCCAGYSSNYYRLRECPYAICDGKINPQGACNIAYNNDRIIYRPGEYGFREENNSGGNCSSPNQCSACNDGFYPDGPYCRICPKIAHCLHRRCTSIQEYRCEYCDGEIVYNRTYWSAYIRGINGNFKECAKACSWRKDSTRCYPGNCLDHGKASSCKCIDGFGGDHCEKIVKDATVSFALAKLKGPGDPIETPADPNNPVQEEIKWTNQKLIRTAELNSTSVFRSKDTFTKPNKTGQNNFITEFEYGIIMGEVRLTFVRESDENFTLTPIVISCIPPQPTTDRFDCGNEVSLENNPEWGALSHFSHDDKVIFSYSITNGGWLNYIDRDIHPVPSTTTPRHHIKIQGRTVTTKFTFNWDLEEPYHSLVETYGTNCTLPPIDTPDITNEVNSY